MRVTGDWLKTAKAIGALANFSTQAIGAEVGEALLTSTKRRFKEGKGPDGTAWPKSARVKAEGGQTLVQRRRLERSITYKVSPGQVDIGTNDRRAEVHQLGKTIKPRRKKALTFKVRAKAGRKKWQFVTVKQVKMPARPFIGLSREDEQTVSTIIADHLKEAIR